MYQFESPDVLAEEEVGINGRIRQAGVEQARAHDSDGVLQAREGALSTPATAPSDHALGSRPNPELPGRLHLLRFQDGDRQADRKRGTTEARAGGRRNPEGHAAQPRSSGLEREATRAGVRERLTTSTRSRAPVAE